MVSRVCKYSMAYIVHVTGSSILTAAMIAHVVPVLRLLPSYPLPHMTPQRSSCQPSLTSQTSAHSAHVPNLLYAEAPRACAGDFIPSVCPPSAICQYALDKWNVQRELCAAGRCVPHARAGNHSMAIALASCTCLWQTLSFEDVGVCVHATVSYLCSCI